VSEIFRTFFTLYLLSQGSAVVGALVIWMAAHDDEPSEQPPAQPVLETLRLASAVSHRRTVSWPVPAPEQLKDDTTRPIRVNRPCCRTTYLHGEGRHRAPESLSRVPDFTAELPQVTSPRLDWSAHPSGEYPVLGGVQR
jgi:hypothetical protein